jgi:flagellum-specific peptidoglycan hydrolase FlgJ
VSLTAAQIAVGQEAASALLSAGMSIGFLPLALAQIAFETGGFNSRILSVDNNLSGIKYVRQAGATQGSMSPEGNNYAHFANYTAWATDYIRIISRGSNPPIQQTDTASLANALKANGYYTDSVGNYANGLAAWLPAVSSISATAAKKKRTTTSLTIGLIFILLFAAIYYYKFLRK